MRIPSAAVMASLALGVLPAQAQTEPIDYNMINRITDEGFNRSEVMETLTTMTDEIGPRLTNSPGMHKAATWAEGQFESWGLQNAHQEYFPFGRGWSYQKSYVHMTAPRRVQLHALPNAWHPGTNGVLEAETILAPMSSESDFEKYKGKLAGKIVLIESAGKVFEPSNKLFTRLDEHDLEDIATFKIPDDHSIGAGGFEKILLFREKLTAFLKEEGAAAMVARSRTEGGLVKAEGYQHKQGETPEIPAITVASEDYDRMARLLDKGKSVSMSIDVEVSFYDENLNGRNVIAEIPGRGGSPEIVMAGAHFDSWFMADGAVDNGAGSAVIMEAARILSALKVKPKRTIRFALWSGEEQGLYGSINYVEQHFASRPNTPPSGDRHTKYFWMNDVWPITTKSDYQRFSAYFNLDNGSGRIRGIYGEGNAALQPIFERWLEPFHEYGAETVVLNSTAGTDHEPFQSVGLPGFQFIQDPLDYGARLHHSTIDTASHAYEKDMKQSAVILASILWHAANRPERLPRMPMPTEPKYPDADE